MENVLKKRCEKQVLEFSEVREMGFNEDEVSRNRMKKVSVFSACRQGKHAVNRGGHSSPPISDTGSSVCHLRNV